MKYCKDCRHHYDGLAFGLIEHPGCRRFSYTEEREDPVHGIQSFPHWESCRKMREDDGQCGPEARAFEARRIEPPKKPTLWQRLTDGWAL